MLRIGSVCTRTGRKWGGPGWTKAPVTDWRKFHDVHTHCPARAADAGCCERSARRVLRGRRLGERLDPLRLCEEKRERTRLRQEAQMQERRTETELEHARSGRQERQQRDQRGQWDQRQRRRRQTAAE